MSGHNKYYTIMFVPEDNARTFSVRVNRGIIRTCAFFIALLCVGLLVLVLLSGKISLKLQMVDVLRKENQELAHQNEALVQSFEKMKKTEELSMYLSNLAHSLGETPVDQKEISALKTVRQVDTEPQLSDTQIMENELPETTPLIGAPVASFWSSVPNIRPVDGWITKKFNDNSAESAHKGLDFAATEGTPIRATAPGIIVNIDNDKFLGLIVTIEHKYDFVTRYGHCSQVLVSTGSEIQRGQTIALVGNTGRSSAPHLHYEIIKDETQIDPVKYMFFNAYD
ncbi:MAG: peptidoglycan DD-metalloendopeptidase family protein [Chitinivibrionales bacterium]|nr:peptidoglycan DD-metalloendopeptidase family protein [Chitinivibrionales bacterium]